jgi:hypothetical protein
MYKKFFICTYLLPRVEAGKNTSTVISVPKTRKFNATSTKPATGLDSKQVIFTRLIYSHFSQYRF